MKMTLEDFRRVAVVPRKAGGMALSAVAILGALLLYNAMNTWNSMDLNPGASYWDIFWVVNGKDGSVDPMLVAMVWGPVVLLPVILVLIVIDLLTHGGRVRRFHERYLRDGWVAHQIRTGLHVTVGKTRVEVVVLSGPGQPAEELAPAVAQAAARVNAMSGPERRGWDAAVAARGVQDGFAVRDLMPELPPQVIACARRPKSDHAVVVAGKNGATILAARQAPAPVPA